MRELDIGRVKATELNEAVAEHFRLPPARRGLAPAVFAGAGGLVREDINFQGLGDLIMRSVGIPDEEWLPGPELGTEPQQVASTSADAASRRPRVALRPSTWLPVGLAALLLAVLVLKALRRPSLEEELAA